MGMLYWLDKWVPNLIGLALIVLILAASAAVMGFTVQTLANKQVLIAAPVTVAPAACTAEQAMMWWNNSKDIKAAKVRLCGK